MRFLRATLAAATRFSDLPQSRPSRSRTRCSWPAMNRHSGLLQGDHVFTTGLYRAICFDSTHWQRTLATRLWLENGDCSGDRVLLSDYHKGQKQSADRHSRRCQRKRARHHFRAGRACHHNECVARRRLSGAASSRTAAKVECPKEPSPSLEAQSKGHLNRIMMPHITAHGTNSMRVKRHSLPIIAILDVSERTLWLDVRMGRIYRHGIT